MPLTGVGVGSPPNLGFVAAGAKLKARIEGQVDNPTDRVGMLVRIFYRVNGIPFSQLVFNNAVPVGPSGFSVDTAEFEPLPMYHSVRVIAWDRKATATPSAGGTDVHTVDDMKTRLTRFLGVKGV